MKAGEKSFMRLLPRTLGDEDWWDLVAMRPIAALLLNPFADLACVTPNRLTLVSLLLRFVFVAALVLPPEPWWIAAVCVLQLAAVTDCMDGQLARYRSARSTLGAVLDKAVDATFWAMFFPAIGYVAYRSSGDLLYMHLATATMLLLLLRCYLFMVWRLYRDPAAQQGFDFRLPVVRRGPLPEQPAALGRPPYGSLRNYLHIALLRSPRLLVFDEGDLFLWAGVALLARRPDLFVVCAVAAQIWQVLFRQSVRIWSLARLDRWMGAVRALPVTISSGGVAGKPSRPPAPATCIGAILLSACSVALAAAAVAGLILRADAFLVAAAVALRACLDWLRALLIRRGQATARRWDIYVNEMSWSYGTTAIIYFLGFRCYSETVEPGCLTLAVAGAGAFALLLYFVQMIPTLSAEDGGGEGRPQAHARAATLMAPSHGFIGLLTAVAVAAGGAGMVVVVMLLGLVAWALAALGLTLTEAWRQDGKR